MWNSCLWSFQNLEVVLLHTRRKERTFRDKHRRTVPLSNTVAAHLNSSLCILGQIVPTWSCWLIILSCFYQRTSGVGCYTREMEMGAERTVRQEGQLSHSFTWMRRTKQVRLCNQVQPTVQWWPDKSIVVRQVQGQQCKVGVSKARSWSVRYKASSISQAGAKGKGQSWNAHQRRWTEVLMSLLIALPYNLAVLLGWSRVMHLRHIGDNLEHMEPNPWLGKGGCCRACWCIQGLDSFLAFAMAVTVGIGQTGTSQPLSFLLMHQEMLIPLANGKWRSWFVGVFLFGGFWFFFFQSGNPAAKLVSVWLVGSIEGLSVSVGHFLLAQRQPSSWLDQWKSYSYTLPWLCLTEILSSCRVLRHGQVVSFRCFVWCL